MCADFCQPYGKVGARRNRQFGRRQHALDRFALGAPDRTCTTSAFTTLPIRIRSNTRQMNLLVPSGWTFPASPASHGGGTTIRPPHEMAGAPYSEIRGGTRRTAAIDLIPQAQGGEIDGCTGSLERRYHDGFETAIFDGRYGTKNNRRGRRRCPQTGLGRDSHRKDLSPVDMLSAMCAAIGISVNLAENFPTRTVVAGGLENLFGGRIKIGGRKYRCADLNAEAQRDQPRQSPKACGLKVSWTSKVLEHSTIYP